MIRLLDEATVRQIAAGEVIERPASAVRELLDNALDAGADDITITLEKGGKDFLSVSDNGCGMNAEELKLAPILHATSKISSINDLQRLDTFGFRGEALAAIAEVSLFRASSRPGGEEHGWELTLEWGKALPLAPKGMNAGTVISARSIFERLPARLKFLGSDAGEYRACLGEFIKKALAHPRCAFRVIHNGAENYNLPPASELHQRITALFPDTPLQGFVYNEGGVQAMGFCSPPSWYRPTRSHQFFFVNGRPVEWKGLRGQIAAAYGNYLPPNRFPACFIYLNIPAESADFNVHPQKKEIRFQNEAAIAAAVRRGLRAGLESLPAPGYSDVPTQGSPPRTIISKGEGGNHHFPDFPRRGLGAPPFAKSYRPEEEPALFARGGPKESLLNARYVGQIFHCYLIFEQGQGITLIDFHALHERVRYERLIAQKSIGLEARSLLLPLGFSLPREDAEDFAASMEAFRPLGFSLSRIGEGQFAADSLPVFLDSARAEAVLLDLFYLKKGQPDFLDASLWDSACKSIACKGSVRGGDRLSTEEITALLMQWEEIGCPPSCPHGRPITLKLERSFFDKEFKRLGF